MNRNASLHRLRSEDFDICIIGGGATGAGCALDAATRGFRTALIEQDDFAAATSGTSTKLVHGGVRYLEQAFKNFDHRQLSLVRKALHERRTLLQIAPHLVHPLALLTPCFDLFEGLYYTIGLKLYDLLAGSRRIKPSEWLSKEETLNRFPAFDGHRLHSAVLYYDGQFDDVRLNLALVQTAAAHGAAVANHLRAEQFDAAPNGQLNAVTVRDRLTGEVFVIRAKVFINATGTNADTLRRVAQANQRPRMQASKGAHVVLPANAIAQGEAALLVPKTKDGRVLFAIPWRGHWLIGTTDTPADPYETPYLQPDEADYLLEHVNKFLKEPVTLGQVTGGFAGLRPLLQPDQNATLQKTETRNVVRDHEVEVDPQSKLVSIMGGKWTTYRLMAEETIDTCGQLLGQALPCRTETIPLIGSEAFTESFGNTFTRKESNLPGKVAAHLVDTYGVRAEALATLCAAEPELTEGLVDAHPFIRAEVVYAVREEMAQTMPDMLLRRIRLGLVDWLATLEVLPVVADLMARELGWTAAEKQQEESRFRAHMEEVIGQAGLSAPTEINKA
ncbi:FAD-dependent oxidoreductase [Nibrella saemangeumensis]|uniref:Glycerol-3-phosphate dehydrogenase n=1 Tax=Nibrella saemangeumensis TaxID=1084526 RepID=A0ABP8ME37_9BACT